MNEPKNGGAGGRRRNALVATVLVMTAPSILWGGCSSGTSTSNTGGTGGGTACGSGSTLCGGSCVDTKTDNANCGACGTLATLGPESFAHELEPVIGRAAAGYDTERRAMLPIASWVAHACAGGQASRLFAIGAAAAEAGLSLTQAMFDETEPRAAIAEGTRLAEVGIAVFATISGLPSRRWPWETVQEWQQSRAWCMNSPSVQCFMVRRLVERGRMHHDPVFIGRLLDQRWVRARDVVLIAARRPTVPASVLAVATRDRWFRFGCVREALAANPYAPAVLARALATVTTERGPSSPTHRQPLPMDRAPTS